MTKICSKCKIEKSLEEFCKDTRRSDGRGSSCKVCHNVVSSLHYVKNSTKRKQYSTEWQRKNRERVTAAYNKRMEDLEKKQRSEYVKKLSRLKRKEKIYAYTRSWKAKNRDKCNASTTKYILAKLKAMPSWLTEEQHTQILEFYTKAKELTEKTGIIHHVDHILPIQGENSCGLHVPWNLQILTRSENCSKKNKIINSGGYLESGADWR